MRAALILAVVLGSACGKSPPASPGPVGGVVAVRIESHHWNDVVISYYHDGVWERLGMAGAVKSSTFEIPWRRLLTSASIRLQADPVSGADPISTDVLPIQPGKLIVWTLENHLEQSSVGVY